MKKLAAPVPRLALSPQEAAAAVSLGPDAFAARVMPHLRVVRCGRRTLVPVAEIERWLSEAAERPLAEQVGR